jgi:hypothetical protein
MISTSSMLIGRLISQPAWKVVSQPQLKELRRPFESLGNVYTAKTMWARARDHFLENASSRYYTVADVHKHADGLRCRLTRFLRHAIVVPLDIYIYNRQAVCG